MHHIKKDATISQFLKRSNDMVNIQRDIESRLGKGVDLKYEICKANIFMLFEKVLSLI